MTTTRQSIVTWHKWPENGVEGLPEDVLLVIKFKVGGVAHHHAYVSADGKLRWTRGGEVGQFAGKVSHYALASDLETAIDVEHQQVATHSPKQISGTSPGEATIKPDLKVQNEDRVRWLVEMSVNLCPPTRYDVSDEKIIEWILNLEKAARAQVERERKEANHECTA